MTTAREIIESFESSFADKVVLAESLELIWLRKAVSRYSVELDPLNYDANERQFDADLGGYVIDTLAAYMKQMYMEREVSRVNKQISIVGRDISIDGAGHTKAAAKNELENTKEQSVQMTFNQKPTAYN